VLAVKVVEPPVQNEVLPAIDTVGKGLAVTHTCCDVALQPLLLVTLTV
jgi:hypothetical protein